MPETADYNSDPAAIAWARAKIQRRADHYRDWEKQARAQGETERANQWRMVAQCMERDFLGSGGCVIAAFDRSPRCYTRPPPDLVARHRRGSRGRATTTPQTTRHEHHGDTDERHQDPRPDPGERRTLRR
jgi:hypothetical protein